MKTSKTKPLMETAARDGAPIAPPDDRPAGPPTAEAEAEAEAPRRPDPEVLAKAVRRRFTAEHKLRVLREADRCAAGQLGALLRREGLYSSHLTEWRRQREQSALAALAATRRGRPGRHPLAIRVAELEREITHLKQRLQQAETIIEVQKKSPNCWGSP
jgi:transposase-like protein